MCSLAFGVQLICLSWSLGVSLVHDNTHKENSHLFRVAIIGLLHPWGVHGPDRTSGLSTWRTPTLYPLPDFQYYSHEHTHTHTHKEMFCSSKLSWGLQEIKESPAATHTITIALHHFLYRAVYYQCSRWGEQSQVHSTLGSKNPKGRFCRGSKICLPETCLIGMKINLGWSFLTNRRLRMSFFLSPP